MWESGIMPGSNQTPHHLLKGLHALTLDICIHRNYTSLSLLVDLFSDKCTCKSAWSPSKKKKKQTICSKTIFPQFVLQMLSDSLSLAQSIFERNWRKCIRIIWISVFFFHLVGFYFLVKLHQNTHKHTAQLISIIFYYLTSRPLGKNACCTCRWQTYHISANIMKDRDINSKTQSWCSTERK